MFINKIKTAFDKGAITYDTVAHIQKEVANKLVNETVSFTTNFNIKNIIDIASGTGYVTAELLNSYPKARYIVNDLSTKMLRIAKQKLATFNNIEYLHNDAAKIDLLSYDLAISSMSLQWFTNLPGFLNRLFNHTKILAFSVLAADTFASWYEILTKFGITNHIKFYSLSKLEKICLSMMPKRCRIFNISYPIELLNALAMVQYLKKLGATANEENKNIIKDLIQTHKTPIKTSYEVFFAILEH